MLRNLASQWLNHLQPETIHSISADTPEVSRAFLFSGDPVHQHTTVFIIISLPLPHILERPL